MKDSYAKYVRPLISGKVVQYFHKELMEDNEKILFLEEERGITKNMIIYFTLGWDMNEDALTVPIKNDHDYYIDCRKIRFNLPEEEKSFKNLPFDWQLSKKKKENGEMTHGKGGRLFPYQNVTGGVLFLCEGETDCIVLNQHGFNAITTGSVNSWKRWLPLLKNKDIVICFDNDTAGIKEASKLQQKLYPVNKSVTNVELPKKGMDITDFFQAGYSSEDLNTLVESSKTERTVDEFEEEEGQVDTRFNSLLDLCNPKNHGVTGTVSCQLTAEKESQYTLPTKVNVHCDMDNGKKCQGCAMQLSCGVVSNPVTPGSPSFLEMVGTSDTNILKMFGPISGAPATCPHVFIDKKDMVSVQELKLSSPLTRSKDTKNIDNVVALSLVGKLILNAEYDLTGTVTTDPKTQKTVFVVSEAKLNENSHTNFKVPNIDTVNEYKRKFNAERDHPESILKKHKELMEILSKNVTYIYGRPDLHTVIDLTYHSPLQFYFDGVLKNSYMESLVLGDSNTGKNGVLDSLCKYYQAGRVVDSSSTSRAGLVAGVDSNGFFSWGLYVQLHTQLIGLNEAAKLNDILDELRVIREGKADYIKVGRKAQTTCMTRAVMLANDPSGTLSTNTFPVQSVSKMIPQAASITRFTLAYFMREEDTPHDLINSKNPAKIETDITQADFQFKLSNAWALLPENVVFTEKAIKKVYKLAKKMASKYSHTIPLVQSSVQSIKIAIVAASLAAELYNMNADGTKLRITAAFVQAACELVMSHYDSDASGYLAYSEDIKKKSSLYQMDKFEEEILNIHTHNGGVEVDMYENFLDTLYLTKDSLELIVEGLTIPQKQQRVLTRLKKSRCVHNTINGWEKTKAFTTYLKEKLNETL